MSVFVIELADRALAFAKDGHVLSIAPSAVFDGTDGSQVGVNAWHALRTQPRRISSRHLTSILTRRNATLRAESLVVAELKARLAEQPVGDTDKVWIVAPAGSEAAGLSAMLGIARRMALPVTGFVDYAAIAAAAATSAAASSAAATSAAGATAATTPARNAVVLELGLHHAAATAVDNEGGQWRRRRSVVSDRGGLLELYQTWLDLVSTTMVKRTRFDPLHDASTEQQLFDSLPHLTAAAAAGGATATVVRNGHRFEVELTRDQFGQAAEPVYRSIAGLLHQLRPAGMPVSIIIPRAAAALPGLRDLLDQFADCELITVADGYAAAAVSQFGLPDSPEAGESVRLLRRVPLKAQTVPGGNVTGESLGQRRMSSPAPSHVLWDGRAISLNVDCLVVGRSVPDAPRHLILPDGLAGVSRRHCTFVHDGESLILLDHSSFGTFVNGERVSERVRVYAGDRVRLGEPGVELALIAVGDVPPSVAEQT